MSDTRYDPFEDTGGWPFREAPHPEDTEDAPRESLFAAMGDTEVGTPPSFDDPEPDEVAVEDLSLTVDAPEETPMVSEESEPDLASEHLAAPEPGPVGAASEPEPEVVPAPESLAAAPLLDPEATPPEAAADEEEDRLADMAQLDEQANEMEIEEHPAEDVAAEQAAEAVQGDEAESSVATEEPEDREVDLSEHAPGAFAVPPGFDVIEGGPHGFRRNVAVVVSRFNSDVTSRMLDITIAELRDCHVADDAITVVPVPGAFELPVAALALAKTRRFACVVALGCVIRGETAHFDLVAGEAASGLQLAAIETGIPVSFGVITCDTPEQAEERIDRAAEAARTALEMADLFSHVRTRAAG